MTFMYDVQTTNTDAYVHYNFNVGAYSLVGGASAKYFGTKYIEPLRRRFSGRRKRWPVPASGRAANPAPPAASTGRFSTVVTSSVARVRRAASSSTIPPVESAVRRPGEFSWSKGMP